MPPQRIAGKREIARATDQGWASSRRSRVDVARMLAKRLEVAVLAHPGDAMGGRSRHRSLEQVDGLVASIRGAHRCRRHCKESGGRRARSRARAWPRPGLARARPGTPARRRRGRPRRVRSGFCASSRSHRARASRAVASASALMPRATIQGHADGAEEADIVRSQVGGSAEQPHGFVLAAQLVRRRGHRSSAPSRSRARLRWPAGTSARPLRPGQWPATRAPRDACALAKSGSSCRARSVVARTSSKETLARRNAGRGCSRIPQSRPEREQSSGPDPRLARTSVVPTHRTAFTGRASNSSPRR